MQLSVCQSLLMQFFGTPDIWRIEHYAEEL
jgi:hypothetical protein